MQTAFADGVLHAGSAAVGLAVWAIGRHAVDERRRRRAFGMVLLIGALTFPGIDRLTGEGFLHGAELVHYALGTKYFPELGYDGLYDAIARASADLGLPPIERVRDLVSSRVGPGEAAVRRGDVYARRFTPERWVDLQLDVADVHHDLGAIERTAVLDHGFNATPPWIAVARRVVGDRPLVHARLVALACLDPLMLAGLVVAWLWAFGLESTALAVLFAGTAYSFRFAWIGGSILRFDWFVCLGLAMVAFRREKPALAGIAIAWATATRLFPVLFSVAAFASLAARARASRDARPLLRFVAGFAIAAALAFLVGAAAGRGPGAYREFALRFETHRATWASNHIGLESVIVADRILFARGDDDAIDPFESYAADVERARDGRKPLTVLAAAIVLGGIVLAARRLRPEEAMPLGAILCFSTSTISGYYWVMLALAPLVAPRRTTVLLASCTFLHVLVELVADRYTEAHVVVSVAFAAVLADWLAAAARAVPADGRTA